ncbi:Phage protein OS=Lysinibacillus sphaericus OX=1421 GN=LS41612_13340 PE=4 SV=1 [Lysinibacillus sphaericus]
MEESHLLDILKDNYLTIDIAVTVEEYEKMYKVEQRYNLEKLFIEFLNTALEKYTFEGLEKERFISDIKVWAGEIPLKMNNGSSKLGNWFNEEIDWSVDLDK